MLKQHNGVKCYMNLTTRKMEKKSYQAQEGEECSQTSNHNRMLVQFANIPLQDKTNDK